MSDHPQENRESLIAIGSLQGSLTAIYLAIERMVADNRIWQQQHTDDDTRHFDRLESLLEQSMAAIRKESQSGIQTLHGRLDKHEEEITQLKELADIEMGRNQQSARQNQYFRWVITAVMTGIGLWFGFRK